MKAVISTTYDDKYLFFLPIVTWCWNKLGIDVICFKPSKSTRDRRWDEIFYWNKEQHLNISIEQFYCSPDKKATYAQCSRLYAGSLNIPDDEMIITSDVDMAVFRQPIFSTKMCIFGSDLVPEGQYPMCYASAEASVWRMLNGNKSVQESLDTLLGDIECENFRGNYWGKDQETLYNKSKDFADLIQRARFGTQFASHRIDRDDINWRSYLGPDLIDAHLWRPGYTDENFANIMELLQTQYPIDNFDWLINYRNEYIKLL